MGMAEWTLEEAAADLRVAHAKLKTLPRRMRSGRRRRGRPPPLVTFTSTSDCLVADEPPWCPRVDTHCEPCRESLLSASCARHADFSRHAPLASAGPLMKAPVAACMVPVSAGATVAAMPPAMQGTLACASQQLPPAPAAARAVVTPMQQVYSCAPAVRLTPAGLPVCGQQTPLYATVNSPLRFDGNMDAARSGSFGKHFSSPVFVGGAVKQMHQPPPRLVMTNGIPFIPTT